MTSYTVSNLADLEAELTPTDVVIASEKLEGYQMWAGWASTPAGPVDFTVGNYQRRFPETADSRWWRVVRKYNLRKKLEGIPNTVLVGQIYGDTQTLKYGHSGGDLSFAVFGVRYPNHTWMTYWQMTEFVEGLGLSVAPLVYFGAYDEGIIDTLRNQPSRIPGASHAMEGLILRKEDWAGKLYRVMNPEYLVAAETV